MSKTLTPAQENLLRALQSGVRIYYVPAASVRKVGHFYVSGTFRGQRRTAAANALIEKGFAHQSITDWRTLTLTEAGRAWKGDSDETV